MTRAARLHPEVVALGGGHGLARGLAALRLLDRQPTAVVTTADDGGSSGRLRRDLGIIAPGDLRMALLSLARDGRLARVLAHRFRSGELEGHAVGNLMLVALAEQAEGDFVSALDAAAELLDCAGRVLPATTRSVHLHARVDGREVGGQVRVAGAEGRVDAVWLDPPDPEPCKEAIAAIAAAEVVLLGPGSLFTSVIATLAVPAIGRAVVEGDARVVYVANVSTQPGETTNLDAAEHVDALVAHLPDLRLDAVVLHDGPAPPGGGASLGTALDHPAVDRVIRADVLTRDATGAPAWGHDPARLARALAGVLGGGDEDASGR